MKKSTLFFKVMVLLALLQSISIQTVRLKVQTQWGV